MPFDQVLGQSRAMEQLGLILANGRIPSAMIFLGPHNVGKRTTALMVAKALNCVRADGNCCDLCPPCRKIDESVHPDVLVVEPDGQFIKIAQVREISDRLGLIPFEARKRVVVLAQAEKMNPEAANAFLKTLEEPPGNTLIILCAHHPNKLPDTIISRCLPVRFGRLPDSVIGSLIDQEEKLPEHERKFAVAFAQGRVIPDLAKKAEKLMALRDEWLETMESDLGGGAPKRAEKANNWAGADQWQFLLDWMETWFRDLALVHSGGDVGNIINKGLEDQLARWSSRFSHRHVQLCYHRVLRTRARMAFNVNKSLALDALWLEMVG